MAIERCVEIVDHAIDIRIAPSRLTEIAATLMRELKAVLPIASTEWAEATSPYVRAEDRAMLVEGLRRTGI